MKFLGNCIWIIFGGLFWSLGLLLAGLFCCVTIILIPLGLQLFKISNYVLWPFGKRFKKVSRSAFKSVLNIIWAIFFGWEFFIGHMLTGLIFCITIIGIPFGKKYFEIAFFCLFPLGKQVVRA